MALLLGSTFGAATGSSHHNHIHNQHPGAAPSFGAFISINAAGVRFVASRDVLTKEPASRLALLACGVLPCPLDEAGALCINKPPHMLQLVLNWLRDGWCALPTLPAEREELRSLVRWCQLSSMEAWMCSQDLSLGAASASKAVLLGARPSTAGALQQPPHRFSATADSPFTRATSMLLTGTLAPATPPPAGPSSLAASSSSPFRSSFLAGGPNQDLLAAGMFASHGISGAALQAARSSITSPALPAAASPFHHGDHQMMPAPSPAGRAVSGLSSSIAALSTYQSSPAALAAPPLCPQAGDAYKWTTSLLASNPRMQEVVATVLQLAAPQPLVTGQCTGTTTTTCISIRSECQHADGRSTSRVLYTVAGGAPAATCARQPLLVRASGSSPDAWAFELAVSPTSDLHDTFAALPAFLQDNLFALTAVLKEQHGLVLQEDASSRPSCLSCRRHNITITLQRLPA